jgi:hypothetical protein
MYNFCSGGRSVSNSWVIRCFDNRYSCRLQGQCVLVARAGSTRRMWRDDWQADRNRGLLSKWPRARGWANTNTCPPWRLHLQCLPKLWITYNIRRGSSPKAWVVNARPCRQESKTPKFKQISTSEKFRIQNLTEIFSKRTEIVKDTTLG